MAEDQRQDVRGLRSQRGEETPPIHVQGIPDARRLRIANQEGRSESSIDRFMTQWIQMDQARTERETQRREEDQQRMMEQQERMFQLMATAPRPVVAEPPPPAPRLTLQKFNEGVDDMGAYLEMFEATARAAHWPNDQWAMFLRSALSGAGLTAVAAMPADQQLDYPAVKEVLRRQYHITVETFRRRTFEVPFDATSPDVWLAKHQQSFQQWLASSHNDPETTMLIEVTLKRLPRWLEVKMRNLNPQTFEELAEAVARHLANQSILRKEAGVPRPTERSGTNEKNHPREREGKQHFLPSRQHQQPMSPSLRPGQGDGNNSRSLSKDVSQMTCYQCGKKGHLRRDCRVKVESANRAAYVRTNLPKWTREVQVNQNSVVGWLDTGCTKSMIHPRFINKDDYLGWKIPYTTASAKKVWFPAARITLNIDDHTYQLAVGVSSHLTVDMLLGQDVPKFRKLLKEALRGKSNPGLEEQMQTSESVMVVTRAGKKKQELAQSQSELYQERDEAVIHEMESETELEGERDEAVTHEMESETELEGERDEAVTQEMESETELESERDEAVTHEMESGSEQGLGQIFDFDSDVFVVPTQTTHHRSTVASQIQLERISPSQMRSHQLSDSTLEEWRRQADTGGG